MILQIFHKVFSNVLVSSLRRFNISTSHNTEKMKVFTQKRNPITGSTEWDMQDEDYDYHQEIARSAFADMLHDTERNKKYYRALQLAIEKMHNEGKKANVLDIGTGTGLLSIMAARCGADSIVACEAFKPMAECCELILKSNGVADKITLIPRRSTELTVGEDGDLKQKANILVTEVFDTELIGEGALSTFSHAHKCLLEEDCIVVPDSAVIYAQVVECPSLQKWNKLNDLVDEDLELILKTPKKMKDCAGSAAVHDIQLSQLPRTDFRELSDQIPVFYYDWSGKSPIDMKKIVKQKFTVSATGKAQMVFMWWELNMDTEGKIVLSCAPWWNHPNADTSIERPQDSIPWRDHWLQAVYYFPQEITLQKNSELTLISCQDEYSLWFFLENGIKQRNYERHVCECGVHMVWSRTHVSYLNDGRRSKKFLSKLRQCLSQDSVVLDLNGSSFMGLAAAKMGAKTVYIVESFSPNLCILNDYIKENELINVVLIPDANEDILQNVTHVVCDPNYSSAIIPWDNLKTAYLLYKIRDKLKAGVEVIPESLSFWAMPVQFQDLHKIRVPLGKCEGIDMSTFDKLVEGSRGISDGAVEAQPLWEYPCVSRGEPRNILQLDLHALTSSCVGDGDYPIRESETTSMVNINGFVIWASWKIGGKEISCGPVTWPVFGERVDWDPHSRQGVHIMKRTVCVNTDEHWSTQLTVDLSKGHYSFSLGLKSEQLF